MKIICGIVGHQRSAKRAEFDHDLQRWRSLCKHCGTPMTRLARNDWEIDREAAEATSQT